MADRTPLARRIYPIIAYPVQAVIAVLLYGFFAVLPMRWASGLGGWLGRTVGPRLRMTRRAKNNIRRALPEFDDRSVASTVIDMWDNLGRVVAEMPHIDRIARNPSDDIVEVVNAELLTPFREEDRSCIFFSGHFANWELFALVAHRYQVPYAQVYRAANNPFVDLMLRRVRRLEETDIIPKGPEGARKALQVLKEGRRLGMLVDQKMNDGIAVPFFNRDAMTAPALAQLSLRYQIPVLPVRMERVGRALKFRVTILPPLELPDTGDRQQNIQQMMTTANALFEDWIRERPGQWLWLHRRWPDS